MKIQKIFLAAIAINVLALILNVLFLIGDVSAQSCKNWISESEFQKSVEGLPAKPGCKKNEKCFCYDGVDLRKSKIGMKQVDDLTKPIYEYADYIVENQFDEIEEEYIVIEYCPDNYQRSPSEHDCEKLSGYEQKEVEGFVEDEQRKQEVIQKENQQRAKRIHQEKIKARKEYFFNQLMHEDNGDWSSDEAYQDRALRAMGRGNADRE